MAEHDVAGAVRSIGLAGATDFEGFRRACRMLWAAQVAPERVSWHTADDVEAELFEATPGSEPATAPPVNVPASYLPLCESVVLHSDPERFGLMYRLLWRLQTEPGLKHDTHDADWVLAQRMAQDVRRDMHRLQTSVRFRTIASGANDAPLNVAWFEPEHHIVEATAPFLARRFDTLRWAIVTPERSARRDAGGLVFGRGGEREQVPATDAGDMAWLTWLEEIFEVASKKPARRETPDGNDPPRTLPALREALERCRECPIGEHATQAVPGIGPKRARLMFVGEQPGDQEDVQGRPFVGPAGQLFDRALAQLGIARDQVWVSNAVKHFKFELRGTRRIHKTPAQEEALACLHWLESEIVLVDPGALVALGATAARQLLGRPVAVTRQRGQWLGRSDGRKVLITLHPSALLRMAPEDKAAAYAAWLDDLRLAADRFSAGDKRGGNEP
ncbi:MAG: UdgX family uracil-DNA binding protein [Caldimonas sp.]